MNAVRPADANETALGWQFALRQDDGPCALVLSRQGLPILNPDDIPSDAIERGAYVLRDSAKAEPELILIGTGSEVSRVPGGPASVLEAEGVATRVVSMPCFDRFVEQDAALPRHGPAALRARAGVGRGRRHAGLGARGGPGRRDGRHAPASAPRGRPPTLLEHFGFTAENVASTGRQLVNRLSEGNSVDMATAAQTNERLAALLEAGTSPWLDQIRRSLIEQGELERLVREDSLRGVTSNPAIFEKAILGSDDYDEDIERLAGEGLDANDIYLTLAIKDVQLACDVMRPVWEEAGGADGFVSLEVEPGVAFDTDATLRQAHELWERVDRPNVLIKIPATDEGMPAIEDAIAAGINVNVTLLFAVEAYENVAERYIRGHGAPPRGRASRSTCTRSRASSSRAWTPRWTSGWRSWAARTCKGRAAHRQRAARPTSPTSASSRATASPRCARRARRCSARCGPRPGSRTPSTPRRCTSTAWWPPTRSTPCRWPR